MSRFLSFVRNKNNREILAWAGGGLAVTFGGLWAVYVHLSSPDKPSDVRPTSAANCGGIAVGGSAWGNKMTTNNSGNCPPDQKSEKP